MIRAVIELKFGEDFNEGLISVFSDCSSIAPHLRKTTSIYDKFEYMHCAKNYIGAVLGGNRSNLILTSHLECCGKSCPCMHFATGILFNDENTTTYSVFTQDTCDYLNGDYIPSPFVAVVARRSGAVLFTYLDYKKAFCQPLPEGTYTFRDCFLTIISEPELRLQKLLNARADFLSLSHHLTDFLFDQMNLLWPKPDGCGITVCIDDQAVKLQVCRPSALTATNSVSEKKKPKGVITGFNFFAMNQRKEVLNQCKYKPSNNELNAMLGQQWKTMTKLDRQQYALLADRDRLRYTQEMVAYMVETGQDPNTG
jgi:hypothetical protein